MPDDSFQTGGAFDELLSITNGTDSGDPLVGAELGNYRVHSLLAEGGMGRVYRADRIDGSFDRQVAVKILPVGLGREYARRFELERKILASLTHPNIAQLYDAGVSESGNLYLVMELVEGRPIDEYSATLSTRDKVRLMLTLAEVLAFAHAKLIVHRDLKPSNLHVAPDGRIKLLDFGIAKILESPNEMTREFRPFTPKYASPEQLLNEPVSVASDIYQFGLLFLSLYENGSDGNDETSLAVIQQTAKKQTVSVASLVAVRLPAELTAIMDKCLMREPEMRYSSASALADDLRNYLNGFPVAARHPGRIQRTVKFLARNWLPSAAAAAAGLSVMAFILITLQQQAETLEARLLAEQQKARAEETTRFLVELFESNRPSESLGVDLTARDILARGRERLSSEKIDPSLRADLLQTIGDVYRNLGDLQAAIDLVEESLEIKEALYSDSSLEIAVTLSTLGRLYELFGDVNAAVVLSERAYEIQRAQLGDLHETTLQSLGVYAYALQRAERFEQAEAALQSVLEGYKAVHGENHTSVTTALNNLSVFYGELGDHHRAIRYNEEVMKWNAVQLPADHPWVATDLYNYGANLRMVGRFDDALAALNRSLEIRRKTDTGSHMRFAQTYASIAYVESDLGNFDESLRNHVAAVAEAKKVFLPPNPTLARLRQGLTRGYERAGRLDLAEANHKLAHDQWVQLGREESQEMVSNEVLRADLLILRSDYGAAIELLRPIVDGELMYSDQLLAPVHLARAYRLSGRPNLALDEIEGALRLIEGRTGKRSVTYMSALLEAALVFLDSGEYERALESIESHRSFFKESLESEHWVMAFSTVIEATANGKLGNVVNIDELANATEIVSATLPSHDTHLTSARTMLESLKMSPLTR